MPSGRGVRVLLEGDGGSWAKPSRGKWSWNADDMAVTS